MTGVSIDAGGATIDGDLIVPDGAVGVVAFAHGSGSSRHSPRNKSVAGRLNAAGLATLLVDLLTRDEEEVDLRTRELRFDIGLLARRLSAATIFLTHEPETATLPLGYFGASTGAAAALIAAAEHVDRIGAVVSRGGRPDLADDALAKVGAPTLLVVGGRDAAVLDLNRQALARLTVEKRLAVVPGATHLFEEPGTLERVADLASAWYADHLAG
ncbi:MAG TPA: dienelactone hydrolase family protein [Gaiellaceae bacterium]|nr:dienelactone hydrolase family protein [Gaiellaceae bacterium]